MTDPFSVKATGSCHGVSFSPNNIKMTCPPDTPAIHKQILFLIDFRFMDGVNKLLLATQLMALPDRDDSGHLLTKDERSQPMEEVR